LRFSLCKAENGAMRTARRFSALAVVLLWLFLAGSSGAATGQYRDHDLYKDNWPRAADHSPDKLIDINHASLDQLMKAPGMTRSWAGRIVRFRPYRTKLDLVERGVVSGDVYGRFKDYVIAHREAH
jgi:DNA uptake protein ComE-like DNA-binding protein